MDKQIDHVKMQKFNSFTHEEILSNFGDWTTKIEELKEKYSVAIPFEHIIIENFLNEELANIVSELYPADLSLYHKYDNPIEVKFAYDKINLLDNRLKSIFYLLSTTVMENIFSEITDIKLENDPYLNGAGLHLHPRNGRLGIHLDYEIHPISGKQRRLNVILYLSKEWNEEWNGHSELWNSDITKCVVKSPVKFNSAIIFKTNEISWHGVSKKITCPEGVFRKTLAFYYISDKINDSTVDKIGDNGTGFRKKASFVTRPDEENKDKIELFLKIRPFRRLEKKDVETFWPEWNSNTF